VATLADNLFGDGEPKSLTTNEILGRGVNHAFNSPWTGSASLRALPPSPSRRAHPFRHLTGLTPTMMQGPDYEWRSLAGTEDMLALDFDRTPERRLGNHYASLGPPICFLACARGTFSPAQDGPRPARSRGPC
jgi:hypothetical protein